MDLFPPPAAAAVMWSRLARHPLDDPDAAVPMSVRLAHEQQWTHGFTARVLEEYRRFLALAATSPTPVTPSAAVDAAWHAHLLSSRSYWRMCEEILGRPLHHDPSAGGDHEGRRHEAQYRATLDAYAAVFGPPPTDIWPAGPGTGDPGMPPADAWSPPSPSPSEGRRRAPLLLWAAVSGLVGKVLVDRLAVAGWTVGSNGAGTYAVVIGACWAASRLRARLRARSGTAGEVAPRAAAEPDWVAAAVAVPVLTLGAAALGASVLWQATFGVFPAAVWSSGSVLVVGAALVFAIGHVVRLLRNRIVPSVERDGLTAWTVVVAAVMPSTAPVAGAGPTVLVAAVVAAWWIRRRCSVVGDVGPIGPLDVGDLAVLHGRRRAPVWAALASLDRCGVVRFEGRSVRLVGPTETVTDPVERAVVAYLQGRLPKVPTTVEVARRVDWGRSDRVRALRERGLLVDREPVRMAARVLLPAGSVVVGSVAAVVVGWDPSYGRPLATWSVPLVVAVLVLAEAPSTVATPRGAFARAWSAHEVRRWLAADRRPADFASIARAAAPAAVLGASLDAAIRPVPGEDLAVELGAPTGDGGGGSGGCGGGGGGGGCGGG